MKKIELLRGSHPAPFDAEGNATLCIQEYTAYLAGEPHSDSPQCVSPVLTAFMVPFNDVLDYEKRQRLRVYAVRQIGTRGDGQDGVRMHMALDWLLRTHTPAFLRVAGLQEEADALQSLAPILGLEEVQAAIPKICAAHGAAGHAVSEATHDAAYDAAHLAAFSAASEAAGVSAGHAASAAYDASCAATYDAAHDAARAAADGAAAHGAAYDVAYAASCAATHDAAYDAASEAAGAAARAAAYDAARGTARVAAIKKLRPTVEMLQESAFALLERMCDPAGQHDIPLEEECFVKHGTRVT